MWELLDSHLASVHCTIVLRRRFILVVFGASVTEADLIMSDGKSLEKTGVTPDEIILPTPSQLAGGRIPSWRGRQS